jgi:hypothetical protein
MSLAIIRKAFETRLKTWADAQTPAIPVAWPNVTFTPPAGRYVRAFVLPADTTSDTLDKLHRAYTGIFQVSLCMPLNTGSGSAESLAASLDTAFAASMLQDGLRIFLTRPMSAAPAIVEPDRYIVPVSGRYRADVA